MHRRDGDFKFDLPLLLPEAREVSEMNRSDGRRSDETAPRPAEPAVTAAYEAVWAAASKGDLKGVLDAQGFAPKAIEKIRGLDGIDADLAVFADRFLQPGPRRPANSRPVPEPRTSGRRV